MEPLPLTAAHIVSATGGRLLQGAPETPIAGISIDSRAIPAGSFFVAIRGERFDGHRFVGDAFARGAAGAMVDDASAVGAVAKDVPVIQVGDTTRGLQDVARDVRRRAGAKVVAITGSAGKTTTKEIAAEFLAAKYRVFRNQGNLNNHIGLPLSLLELRARPEVAVVELGMNHPGEIRTLVGIAEPEIRVWTNVGDAHMGFFASLDAIADAKAEILEAARPGDVLVANAGDARIMSRAGGFRGRVVTFGVGMPADVQAAGIRHGGLEGMAAEIRTPAGSASLVTPLLGTGNLANILAAAAVALELGVQLNEVVARSRSLKPAHHRGELLRLPGGLTLIDDSYNSSPAALKRTLETVAAASGSARKVAVLGEMLELGEHAARLHEECGRAAAAAGLDLLIAVGGSPSAALARAAAAAGMPSSAVVHMATSQEAADAATKRVRPGDLVLVKGSRGIGTDLVVQRLKEEFA